MWFVYGRISACWFRILLVIWFGYIILVIICGLAIFFFEGYIGVYIFIDFIRGGLGSLAVALSFSLFMFGVFW